MVSVMAGEEAHDTGSDGLRRAKRWFDMTTRVSRTWTHHDRALASLLEFDWPGGGSFSFDMGGDFRGSELDGQSFVSEVKRYRNESDLPAHFRSFLAKSYVAYGQRPQNCDHIIWLSWSPFQAKSWDIHRSPNRIRTALTHESNRMKALCSNDPAIAAAAIDNERVIEVSKRLWLLTLCDEQEQLVLSSEHFGQVVQSIVTASVAP